MDSLRIKLSFFISCVFHFVFLVGVGLVPHHKPIVVTFPVELITLPAEKIETNTEVISPKKEEIIIPKKPQKKVLTKQKEEKKEIPKPQIEPQTKSVSETSQSLTLETAKFPFSYYIKQVQSKISQNWTWAKSYSGSYTTVVYFRILRSGEISDLRVKTSSGNKLYDNICLRAVEVSSPFPPLPDGYNDNWLGVYFEFKYSE